MVRKWEEFQFGPNRNGDLRVTLNRKGDLMIGAKAYEQLGKPEVAVLMFDRENGVLGVCPTNKYAKNGYPFLAKRGGRHRIVRANRFCRHYGINVDRTVAFDRPEIDHNGVLVLDLTRITKVGKKQEMRKKK